MSDPGVELELLELEAELLELDRARHTAHPHTHLARPRRLTDLERLELELDIAEGRAPTGATRPLTPEERAAGTMFADLVADVDGLTDRMTTRMLEARGQAAGELRTLLERAAAGDIPALGPGDRRGPAGFIADLMRALDDPAMSRGLAFGANINAELVPEMRVMLEQAAGEGYARALSEARAQGIPTEALAGVNLEVLEDHLDRSAIRLGTEPVRHARTLAAARFHDLPVFDLPPEESIDELAGAVDEGGEAAFRNAARPEAHKLNGLGRAQAAAALPEPERIYASELMDGSTCAPCSRVDGRQYPNLEAARLDYPEGRYLRCEGGERCRGTLVFVWPTEEPPTVDDTEPGDDGDEPDTPPAGPTPTPPAPAPSLEGGDWRDRLDRLRAQRPDTWAPITLEPWTTAGPRWGEEFARQQGRRPTFDEYRQAEAAHSAAALDTAATHERLIRQAGEVIDAEVQRRVAALGPVDRSGVHDLIRQQGEAEDAYRAARTRVKELERQLPPTPERRAWYETPEGKAWAQRRLEAANEANAAAIRIREIDPLRRELELELGDQAGRVAREVLGEVQAMGPGGARHTYASGSTKGKGTVPLEEALELMPRRWVEASVEHSRNELPLYVGHIERAHYRPMDVRRTKAKGAERIARLNVSGETKRAQVRAAAHEFGHRIEHMLPEVRRLEHVFYRRRTTQDDGTLERLRQIYAGNRQEVAREDKFVELYMGKDYGNRPDSYYELLSTGLEGVFTGRWDALETDADMRSFIFGLLTMV
jgi:hypothetical protein